MVPTDNFIKLQAQVQGLEQVLKVLIALHFASKVKDETGFAKAAAEAAAIKKVAVDHLLSVEDQMRAIMPDVADITLGEMRATLTRCWGEPEGQMRQLAEAILSVSQPPTDAKN